MIITVRSIPQPPPSFVPYRYRTPFNHLTPKPDTGSSPEFPIPSFLVNLTQRPRISVHSHLSAVLSRDPVGILLQLEL